jgi:hypothetical protein
LLTPGQGSDGGQLLEQLRGGDAGAQLEGRERGPVALGVRVPLAGAPGERRTPAVRALGQLARRARERPQPGGRVGRRTHPFQVARGALPALGGGGHGLRFAATHPPLDPVDGARFQRGIGAQVREQRVDGRLVAGRPTERCQRAPDARRGER